MKQRRPSLDTWAFLVLPLALLWLLIATTSSEKLDWPSKLMAIIATGAGWIGIVWLRGRQR